MNILVLNCGSSLVKFQLIATDLDRIAQNQDERLARGMIERIGGEAVITLRAERRAPQRSTATLRDTRAAIGFVIRWASSEESGIKRIASLEDIQAVGHRVVHGGERFTDSALITDEVLRGIEECISTNVYESGFEVWRLKSRRFFDGIRGRGTSANFATSSNA